jgi:CheY-like chemotaxis protein
MDGYEVARAFRADEVLRQIPVVALSGYALPEDVEHASRAGFAAHLAKPPSLQQLTDLLTRLPSAPAERPAERPTT